MKRFLSVVTAAAMALSTMTAFGASENQAIAEPNNNGRHVDAGYLVRDSFPYYQSGNWEFKGEWLPSNETIAMLADTSADSYTEMERIFVQKSSGIVTAEFRIIPVMGSSGAYYTFRDSSTGEDAVTISVEQTGSKYDQCYYVKEDGEKQFIGELPNTDITVAQKNDSIGFKIVMDIDTKTVDIYFNGELKVDGENFTNPEVTGVGTIAFGISREGKGIYQPGTLNIYTGYGVYEDFVSANPVEFSNPEWNYVQNLPVWVFNAGYSLSDGTIPNSNNDEKWMGNDGNLTTYWEGNLPDPNDPATLPYSLPFDKSCYLLETEGQLLKINKIVITEPDHRADTYQLCYNYADGTEWGAWRYIGFDGENFDLNAPPDTYIDSDLLPLSTPDHQIVITLPEPIYCRMIGINFGTPVEEGMKPAVSEFVAYYDAAADPNANLIDENNLPDDWTVTGPDGSVQVVQSSRYSKAQDYNVVSFKDASNEQAAYMEQNFTLIDGNKGVSIDFDMLLQSTQSKGAEVVVTQDNGNELRLYAQGDEIFVAATGMEEPISILQGCKTNIWQHFQLKYQKDTGTLQVTKDGSSPENAEAISLPESFQTGNFHHVSLGFSEEAVGEAQFDNIRILALVNENVVPEPQPVDTGDTIVQAQICTLWRDGSAHGWKYVDGRDEETGEALFLDRKPILGWYDESDPEVTDWQIKWAVEHGISSFMYCWYRNNTGPIPTKETMCTDALYYGQYNAKYRDYMKYTIMWENTTGYGMYGAEDLLENLMPHWIETMFKNPNYLKTTDNKPILYIYDYSVLMQQVGDFDNNGVPNEYSDVRKLFDEMRQMCVDAGFGGLVIATEDRHASSSRISDISQCGFDNIFQYCYTVDRPNPTDNDMFNSIQNTLYTQLEGVENAPGDNKPGIVPSVSMGWDYTPWAEIYGVTEDQFETVFSYSYRFDYDAYHQLAEWVRDTFLNTEGVATFGTEETGIQKMVMLDNWNEFGEGHFIMPTLGSTTAPGGEKGFGYLDAIRDVYATNGDNVEHEDMNPLKNGYGPYDKWYWRGWDQDENVRVKGVSLEEESITLYATGSDTAYIQPVIEPLNANDDSVIYRSLTPEIVSVSQNGQVRGLKAGTGKIEIITNDGGFSTTCDIEVKLPYITSSVYQVDLQQSVISGIEPDTSYVLFQNRVDNPSSQLTLFTADGEEVTANSAVLTSGMKLQFEVNGMVYHTVTVSVLGDVNGDGLVNVSDTVRETAHILGRTTLEQPYLASADINGDGKINITDVVKTTLYVLNGSFTYD